MEIEWKQSQQTEGPRLGIDPELAMSNNEGKQHHISNSPLSTFVPFLIFTLLLHSSSHTSIIFTTTPHPSL